MKALTPWTRSLSPWNDLEQIQDRVNRVFGRNTPTFFTEEPLAWRPDVNLKELDGEYLLTAELPGMTIDQIEVDVDRDTLTIKGEKKDEREEEKEGRWHLYERSWGTFERSFTLPRAVESDAVKADFSDGVLTVHLPKRKEAMGRKIEINRPK